MNLNEPLIIVNFREFIAHKFYFLFLSLSQNYILTLFTERTDDLVTEGREFSTREMRRNVWPGDLSRTLKRREVNRRAVSADPEEISPMCFQ